MFLSLMSLSVIYNLNAQGVNKHSAKEFGNALTQIGKTIAEHYEHENSTSLEDLLRDKKNDLINELAILKKELKGLTLQEKSFMNKVRMNQKHKGNRFAKSNRAKQNANSEYRSQRMYELNCILKQKENQIQVLENIG